MANSVRFDSGRNVSMSTTPTFRIGGCWMARTSTSSERFCRFAQKWETMLESKMCSGDCTGSAFTFIKPNMLETVLSMRSERISRSSMIASDGASRELRIETGSPTLFPYTTLFRQIGRASCRERVYANAVDDEVRFDKSVFFLFLSLIGSKFEVDCFSDYILGGW